MPTETSSFDDQFDRLLELAELNEATGGNTAWFKSEVPKGALPGQYRTETTRIVEAHGYYGEVYNPGPGVAEPDWMSNPGSRNIDITHEHTVVDATADTPLVTGHINKIHPWNTQGEGWLVPLPGPFRPIQVGRVCVRWAWLADTHDRLGAVTQTYLDWMQSDRKESATGDNSRMASTSVVRSIRIAQEQGTSYDDAGPYVDTLTRLDLENNKHHQEIREVAELAITSIVAGDTITRGGLRLGTKSVSQPLMTEVVQAFEERGLLTSAWWMGTAISAGVAIAVPPLRPMAYEKLAGENGADLLEYIDPKNSQAIIETYIATLFRAYAKDDTRDPKLMKRINEVLINGRGMVDLKGLIHAADVMIQKEGATLESNRRRPGLDRNSMLCVGDALLVLLERTRLSSNSDEVWADQFEQDVEHAEMIDILHALLRHGRTEAIREESLRLRYPLASDDTLTTIRGALTAGEPPARVRAQFRGRQGRTVSAWRARKPGTGLVS